MNTKHFAMLLILGLCMTTARAGDLGFTFVPPPMDGTLSLGIFDEKGNLRRVLFAAAKPEELPQALNGFQVTWDGKDDGGATVPQGSYVATGFVTGPILIQADGIRFNDWMLSLPEGEPAGLRHGPVIDGALLPDGRAGLVAMRAGGGAVFLETDPAGKILRRVSLAVDGEKQPVIVVAAGAEGFWVSDGARIFSPGESETLDPKNFELKGVEGLPVQLEWDRDSGVLVTDAGVWTLSRNADGLFLATKVPLSGESRVLSAAKSGERLYWIEESGKGHSAKLSPDGSLTDKLPLPEALGKLRYVSAAAEGVWLVATREGAGLLLQLAADGTVAREMGFDASEPPLLRVAAAWPPEALLLIEGSPLLQRTRHLRWQEGKMEDGEKAGQVSYWSIIFDRSVKDARRVLFEGGEPKPTAGPLQLPAAPRFSLVENPLTNEKTPGLTLAAALDGDVCWLATADGLPLLEVATIPGAEWACLVPGNEAASAKIFVSDGVSIHAFRLGGIDAIMEFDAGELSYPQDPSLTE